MRSLILAGLLIGLAFPHQVGAQAPPPEARAPKGEKGRVELFDSRSNQTGYAVVEPGTGRVDFYDAKSRRTGYGKVGDGGRLEVFDHKGRRVGEGAPAQQ